MNLIRIEGSRNVLLKLRGIEGLILVEHSATQLDEEKWSLSGYATNEAIGVVEARGATVRIVMTEQERREHINEQLSQMRHSESTSEEGPV